MSDQVPDSPLAAEAPAEMAGDGAGDARLVPVAEAIRHRRRAQQAEGKLQEFEQQLEAFQSQLRRRDDELAAAEAQRDEARTQLTVVENRLATERLLNEAGVVDLETASLLLSKRVDFSEALDGEALARAAEQLLLDKPFLRSPLPALPPKTASARQDGAASASRLARAAEAAAESGDRRDVAAYLRLRRQASLSGR